MCASVRTTAHAARAKRGSAGFTKLPSVNSRRHPHGRRMHRTDELELQREQGLPPWQNPCLGKPHRAACR